MNIVEILEKSQIFAGLSAESFKRIAGIARICNFRKGQLVFRENEPCEGFYVIGQGQVRVFKIGANGREHVLHILGPGDSFAEVAAIGDFPLPASAEALEKSVCAKIPTDQFQKLLHQDHQLCLDMMIGMSSWIRRLVTLLEDITLRDAAGRLAKYLLELAPSRPETGEIVKLPGLKRYVASHLNLTSETFSRTLRRLIVAGLVAEVGSDKIQILHPKKLQQIAEGLFPRY